ncbi:hypothetical protein MYX07_04620, partial [Patescibacteria group bacterium AH-259-L07]|nr:hypothetical protein [Patescibacteria group bacterium AH-259-L07]
MFGQAMKKILEILRERDVEMRQMRALEVFAREGDWQTMIYADSIKSLDAWEVDHRFEKKLRKNLLKANIKI